MKTVNKINNDTLAPTQRWTGLFIVVGMLLLFGFFLFNQKNNTGFFTSKFRTLEMFCLYGPIVVSLTPPIVRAVTGRQNPSRPFDAATNLALAIGSFWLWLVFPFDFAHLGDILPKIFHIVTSLITNNVGKIVLMLQWIVGPITAVFTILKYLSVRRQGVAE